LLGSVETPRDMDVEALWQLLQAERARHAAELEERDQKIAAHEDARASDHELIARLSRIIRDLQRTTFGARSEKLDPDQLALALEDLEQELASAEVRLSTPAEKAASAARRRANRGSLPAHLPRVEQVIDIEDKTCPCCAGALHRIGEDVAERLDVIPATFRALVVRRPKYGCRACEEVVVQAPAPTRLIEGGLPTEWAYARDDRPWGGPAPPGVAFVYAGDRAASSPAQHLAGYRGVLQTDGYGAYKTLAKGGAVELAFCWTHTRRYFHKLLDEKTPAKTPIAAEAIARIGQLYAVEAEIRGRAADERRAVRQEKSTAILADLKPWLSARLELISQKGDLAKAIRYVLTHWDGLTRFVDDGRIELDTNTVERAIRPLALTRKNSLFAGSEGGAEHWAVLASLIATCKLNDVEPQAYIEDVITKLINGHLQSRLDELLPWAYAPKPVAAAA
jgi:hypothetical protein